ncbi:MAG: hypothetical protein M5U28_19965 [Sandaracinaceae bacterium]|nr:hypothetical protein [Sandaracinaceae bacterium]
MSGLVWVSAPSATTRTAPIVLGSASASSRPSKQTVLVSTPTVRAAQPSRTTTAEPRGMVALRPGTTAPMRSAKRYSAVSPRMTVLASPSISAQTPTAESAPTSIVSGAAPPKVRVSSPRRTVPVALNARSWRRILPCATAR